MPIKLSWHLHCHIYIILECNHKRRRSHLLNWLWYSGEYKVNMSFDIYYTICIFSNLEFHQKPLSPVMNQIKTALFIRPTESDNVWWTLSLIGYMKRLHKGVIHWIHNRIFHYFRPPPQPINNAPFSMRKSHKKYLKNSKFCHFMSIEIRSLCKGCNWIALS